MITTASEAVAAVDRLGRVLAARLGEVRKRDDYYRGQHRLAYASAKWREFHAERYRDFSDNWCSVVANSPSERLRVTGFKLDDSAAMSGEEQALWGHWQRNDADGQSSQGFLSSIVTGRSAVVVWDDGSGDGVPDMQWDSPDQVVVAYDPARPRRRTAALKTWRDDDAEHATLYTPQALWTQVRESLDVTTVVFNNGSYAILNLELSRVGAEEIGPVAKSMLDLHGPDLDFVALANSMGVQATRATTAEEFTTQLEAALNNEGPHLIDAVVPPLGL